MNVDCQVGGVQSEPMWATWHRLGAVPLRGKLVSEHGESFLLSPERIPGQSVEFVGDSTLLGTGLAPEVREGIAPAITRVLNGDAAEFIMMTFGPGQYLADHRAAHPITIQCLEGELVLTAGDQRYDLRPGSVAHLHPQVVHRVDCSEDAPGKHVLLLTMLTGRQRASG